MAQIYVNNRHKYNKVIPIASNNVKMIKTNQSPHRNTATNVDYKERMQQHQSDSVSVASTVKISNVASLSTASISPITMDGNRFIHVPVDSRDDHHRIISSNSLFNGMDNYQRNLLIAPRIGHVTDNAVNVRMETFLLRAMEGLSPTDYLRIITDNSFVSSKLQHQLTGDRSQPVTTAHLRSIWNDLSVEDYQNISNSFLHHMRIVEKKKTHFTMSRIKSLFNSCRFPPRRRIRSSQDDLFETRPKYNESSSLYPAHDVSPIRTMYPLLVEASKTEELHNRYETYVDPNANQIRSDDIQHIDSKVNIQAPSAPPSPSPDHLATDIEAVTATTVKEMEPQNNYTTAQQDAFMILNDIADHDSISSSINGYTSMSSSIDSSTIHRHRRRSHQRIATSIDRTDSSFSVSSSTQNHLIVLSPSSSSEHQPQQQQQYRYADVDNDSTTSSTTGYLSMGSSSRISISGSVASV